MGRKNKPGNSGFSGHGHSHGALDDHDDHSHGHGHGGFNASSVPVAGSGDIPLALLDRRSSDSPLLGGDADHSVLMQLEPLAVSNARSSAGGLLASHGDGVNSDAEGCRHLAATTTECGHNECLSPEEVKANTARQTLIYVSFFCFAFMVVELVGGYISNSLAIMTDAAHLLSDLASFLISIVSLYVSRKAATSSYSFGFHRAEILGAIVSVLLIWALTGVLLVEAFDRFAHPVPINGVVMFAIATLGLCVNVSMGTLLMYSGHGHSHGLPGSSHGHSHGGDSDDHGHGHSEDDEHDEHDGHDHGHGHNHGGAAELNISTDKSGLLAGAATGGNAAAHRHRSSYGSDSLLASDHSDDDGHGHGGGHGHSHGGDGHGDHDDHDDTHGHSHSASTNKKSNLENMSFYDKLFNNPNHNINLRAAMVHVLGDALQSLGVMLAAALIWYNPNWAVADPICTVVFSFIVLFTTMRIMREAVMVLMEGVPDGLNVAALTADLKAIPGVQRVHDLHVWSLSVGNPALSVHLQVQPVIPASPIPPTPFSPLSDENALAEAEAASAVLGEAGRVLARAQRMLRKKYGISHSTIQIESGEDDISCNTQSTKRACVRA